METTAAQFNAKLEALRTHDGEIGMGKIFALAKACMDMPPEEIESLLESPVHEVRVGAVSIMDWQARDRKISVPGLGDVIAPILVTKTSGAQFAIGLHGPLTPNEPTDADLKDIKEYATSLTVHLEDELVVRRNLPFATQKLIEKLG